MPLLHLNIIEIYDACLVSHESSSFSVYIYFDSSRRQSFSEFIYRLFKRSWIYTTFTNFSMRYLMMCKVYTDVGGIKQLYHICPPVCKIIHSLKLVDYLHVQADNPWYNYYIFLMRVCNDWTAKLINESPGKLPLLS